MEQNMERIGVFKLWFGKEGRLKWIERGKTTPRDKEMFSNWGKEGKEKASLRLVVFITWKTAGVPPHSEEERFKVMLIYADLSTRRRQTKEQI